MNIYHYTKGISIAHIVASGCIKTERDSGFARVQKMTNFVWLTAKQVFPKTALPYFSHLPTTNLMLQAMHKGKLDVDMDSVAERCGGLYRFCFDSADKRFMQWRGSNERRFMMRKPQWVAMEAMANAVGDGISNFWIAPKHILLRNFGLEKYNAGNWELLLKVNDKGVVVMGSEAAMKASANEGAMACIAAGLPAPKFESRAA